MSFPLKFILIATAAFLVSGCQEYSFIEVEKEKTELINSIQSYQSIDDFTKVLSDGSIGWEVIEDYKKSRSSNKPPYHSFVIAINNYSHLDCEGVLVVLFFNNRLMSTRFYPTEYEVYINRLSKQIEKEFRDRQGILVPPFTRIWVYEDQNRKKYVGWEDTRLSKEMDVWISRYS